MKPIRRLTKLDAFLRCLLAPTLAWLVLVSVLAAQDDGDSGAMPPSNILKRGPQNSWVTPEGLIVGGTSKNGKNRIDHLLSHFQDNPNRDGLHGVFDKNVGDVFQLLDDAYRIAKQARPDDPRVASEQHGDRTVYYVDMDRRLGHVGGRDGKKSGFPEAQWLRFVLTPDKRVLSVSPADGPPRPAVVTVVPDEKQNGWDVRVSFNDAPKTFARAGQAWTLGYAKEMAAQAQQKFRSPAGGTALSQVRIQGKEGDGTVQAGQGPRLPDWPLVEREFRDRARIGYDETRLKSAGQAYQKAAQATDEMFSRPKPRPSEKEQKQIGQLYQAYNFSVEEMAKLQGQPVPLPRLRPLKLDQWEPHAANWTEAKRTQYAAEQLAQQARGARSDLMTFIGSGLDKKKKEIQDSQASDTPRTKRQIDSVFKSLAKDIKQAMESVDETQKASDEAQQAVKQQQSALANKIADSSAVLPKADGFASGKNGAIYDSTTRLKAYKTDDKGEILPDDKQPAGYPKPYYAGDPLLANEAPVVEPNLRVTPLDREPGDVKANIFGKVVEVDKDKGAVTVQVDERGTTLEYSGLDPQGVKEGDFLTPSTPIGRWRPPASGGGNRALLIRAWSKTDQPVDPRSVLEFATYPPAAPDSLKRTIPDPPATPLPIKQNPDAPPNGKGKDRAKIDYDESNEKSLESGVPAKNAVLDARELTAKNALKKKQDDDKEKAEQLGYLKAKAKTVNDELQAAKNKSADLKGKVSTLNDSVRARQSRLDAELASLLLKKRLLDNEAARLKGSKNNAAIDAYNQKADKHNRDEAKYQMAKKGLATDEARLNTLKNMQKQAQQNQQKLAGEANKLQSQANAAQAARANAQAQVRAREALLNTIRAERAQSKPSSAKKGSKQ